MRLKSYLITDAIISKGVPQKYLNRYLSAENRRELAEYLSIPDRHNGGIIGWNSIRKYLPDCGYEVSKEIRMNNKRYRKIRKVS